MQFVTVRDFRNASKSIWAKVKNDGEIVITNNGKPTALLIHISENDFEETLQDIRRVQIGRLISKIRRNGVPIEPKRSEIPFADESGRKFYDAAKGYGAILVTGNKLSIFYYKRYSAFSAVSVLH
ncbi:MAG: type II toxin-antitoxin system Phd/YefM family antitoxin [Lachnospiraceae bacterium]|jgi:prevent-host-death family protein|nr:type II toxin-antitoxin system Phd/YefM family antitoxin [Lachnospiraceae bacterium]